MYGSEAIAIEWRAHGRRDGGIGVALERQSVATFCLMPISISLDALGRSSMRGLSGKWGLGPVSGPYPSFQ